MSTLGNIPTWSGSFSRESTLPVSRSSWKFIKVDTIHVSIFIVMFLDAIAPPCTVQTFCLRNTVGLFFPSSCNNGAHIGHSCSTVDIIVTTLKCCCIDSLTRSKSISGLDWIGYEHCNTLVMVMLSNTAVYLEKYGNFCEKWMWNFVAKGADICFTFGYSRYWGFPFIWDPVQFDFVARCYKSASNLNFVAQCYRSASNINLLPDFNLIRLWACAESA